MWKKTLAAAALMTGLISGPAQARNFTPHERTQVSNQMMGALNDQSGGALYIPEVRLNNIFQRIIQGTARRDLNYQLLIQDNSDSVNAYSLPDGRVILLTGLLNSMPPGDDNAMAFVMAHELSHIELHHVEKLTTQGGLTNLALGWLTNNQSSIMQGLAGVGSQLLTSGYSRGMEAEADGNGLELMRRAGYDPRGALVALQLFKSLEESEGQARVFPTHPKAEDRLQDTQAYLQQHGY